MWNIKLAIPQKTKNPILPHWSMVSLKEASTIVDTIDGEPISLTLLSKEQTIRITYLDEKGRKFFLFLSPHKPGKGLDRVAAWFADLLGLS